MKIESNEKKIKYNFIKIQLFLNGRNSNESTGSELRFF